MSEKFIGAILGFFIKLLFCNLAIFLLLYGFISIFYNIAENGFHGSPDQIVFIVFSCLLFFYICKSAPGIAQSLLTGSPSLSATGAISAVGGAIAAAGATMGMARTAGKSLAGGLAKTGAGVGGSLMEAAAASNAVKGGGGTGSQQAGAFMASLRSDAGDRLKAGGLGLARSLMGGGPGGGGSGGGMNPHSWRDTFLQGSKTNEQTGQSEKFTISDVSNLRKQEGANRGLEYLKKKENNQST
jgi:type IV secretory pathway TrbL component